MNSGSLAAELGGLSLPAAHTFTERTCILLWLNALAQLLLISSLLESPPV
jgi:hypothetical protein